MASQVLSANKEAMIAAGKSQAGLPATTIASGDAPANVLGEAPIDNNFSVASLGSDPAASQQTRLAEKLKAENQAPSGITPPTDAMIASGKSQAGIPVTPTAPTDAMIAAGKSQAGVPTDAAIAAGKSQATRPTAPEPIVPTVDLTGTKKAPTKEEKAAATKTTTPVVDETAFNTQKDIDDARAQASSIINLDAAKDDLERQKLEELQRLEKDISIERMQSERILTKRLKESGNFGQGIGNSLQRSFQRDLASTFTDARTTIATNFNKQIADVVAKELDLINAETSGLLSEKRTEDFNNKMASLDASMGLFNSLTDPESQIAMAASLAEQYPEIGYFNDLATNPDLQEALREAAEPERMAAVEANRDKALNLATQFELDIKGTAGSELQEAEMKDRFANFLKQDNEFFFNADVEGWQESLINDSSLLNELYGVEGANDIKDTINNGTFEDAEQAYIDYKWDVAKKASSDNQLKSVLTDSFVGSLNTQAQRDVANDYVDVLTKRTGSEAFIGNIKLDGDTFLGFELADGQVVSDPSQIPGFDVIFEDWDGNAYSEDNGHVRADDPEYFEWLTDKYTDYLKGIKEGEVAVSRDNFRSNVEKYLTDSGADITGAANNPASINISSLPDLRGSDLQNAGQTGIRVTDTVNGAPALEGLDLTKADGGLDIEKVATTLDDFRLGNIDVNNVNEADLRDVIQNAESAGVIKEDAIKSIYDNRVKNNTLGLTVDEYKEPVFKNSRAEKAFEIRKVDFDKISRTLAEPELVVTEDGQLLRATSKLKLDDGFSIITEYTDLNGEQVSIAKSKKIDVPLSSEDDIISATINVGDSEVRLVDIINGTAGIDFTFPDSDSDFGRLVTRTAEGQRV